MTESDTRETKTIRSVIAMVILAPLVAATTLVCGWPERWGGSISPLAIITIGFFGLITTPLWPTYIPAIILTPLLMRKIAPHRLFMKLPIMVLMLMSLLLGAVGGVCVMFPVIRISLQDGADCAVQWEMAGAFSGAITLTVICLIHRDVLSGDSNQ
jgi:hypothetical protein